MKKIINYKILLIALFLSAGMVGCKKNLDINGNKNEPTDSLIKAENIIPNAMHGTGVQTALGYGWLCNWIGYWSPSGSFNPSTEESSYNITNTFAEGKWTGTYNVLFDLDRAEQKAIRDGEQFYQAIAMILKAHLYQNLIDLYGNVPYTEAFKTDEFPAPAYDEAKSIYENLQVRLDAAIAIMEDHEVSDRELFIDVVFGSGTPFKDLDNTEFWIKFANTIKLRLLIRQTQINPNPTAELAKIAAKGGVLQAGESASVHIQYKDEANKQSPFFGTYGLLPSGEDANTFFRANRYAINNFKARDDIRMEYFFKPAKSPVNPGDPFIGTEYGADPDNEFNGDRTSNIGLGLVRDATQPQWILSSVESLFLQAEAVTRGWNIGSPYASPQEAYEAAVTESFVWLEVEDAEDEAANYLSAGSFGEWDDALSTADKIKFIVQQKYSSLTGMNPLEAWNDYRRLGVPSNVPLSINDARGSRLIPVRLQYPSSEFAVNAKNVQAQGSINPQNSTLFWDK